MYYEINTHESPTITIGHRGSILFTYSNYKYQNNHLIKKMNIILLLNIEGTKYFFVY